MKANYMSEKLIDDYDDYVVDYLDGEIKPAKRKRSDDVGLPDTSDIAWSDGEYTDKELAQDEKLDHRDPLVRAYFEEIRAIPRVTPTEEKSLLERLAVGDKAARERLITGFLPLVVKLASKMNRPVKVKFLELVQAGNEGLIHAVDNFDLSHGTRFSTFAVPSIRWKLRDYLDSQVNAIYVPPQAARRHHRISQAYETWVRENYQDDKLAGSPSPEELSKITGESLAHVLDWLADGNRFTTEVGIPGLPLVPGGRPVLDESDDDDADDPIDRDYNPTHPPVDTALRPDEMFEHKEHLVSLYKAVDTLTKRERKFVELKFAEGKSLRSISKTLKISPKKIGEFETKVLAKLRTTLKETEE